METASTLYRKRKQKSKCKKLLSLLLKLYLFSAPEQISREKARKHTMVRLIIEMVCSITMFQDGFFLYRVKKMINVTKILDVLGTNYNFFLFQQKYNSSNMRIKLLSYNIIAIYLLYK